MVQLISNVTATMQFIFDEVRGDLPGLVPEVVQLKFINVLREYFTESLAWVDDQKFTIAAGSSTTSLANWSNTNGSTGEVIAPRFVTWNDVPLQPVSIVSDSIASTETNTPIETIFNPIEETLQFAPIPTQSGTLHVYVALRPPIGTFTMPDKVISDNHKGLKSMLLGELMLQPSKPYTNMKLGAIHLQRGRSQMNRARDRAKRGFAFGKSPWLFPYFARGSGAGIWGYENTVDGTVRQ